MSRTSTERRGQHPVRLGAALLLMLTLLAPPMAQSATSPAANVERASSHPMRYHVALPTGWVAGRAWPVVMVIPDASRDFEGNLQRFVAARGDRPFILVAPEVLSCGGAGSRLPERYSYTRAEWDSLTPAGDHDFDDAGIGAVLADVHARWGGEAKAFLTGWEAGGHTVWAQAFRRPERWLAVAPVTPNYQKRGLTDGTFSIAPERSKLPIREFDCGAPTGDGALALKSVQQQSRQAFADATAHGFAAPQRVVVPNVDHGPLPEIVLGWFSTLMKPARAGR